MFQNYFDKVFVINLDERKDRLESFDKRSKALGLEYERIKAVDGEKEITWDIVSPQSIGQKPIYWTKRMAGMNLSAAKTLKIAKERGYKPGWVHYVMKAREKRKVAW